MAADYKQMMRDLRQFSDFAVKTVLGGGAGGGQFIDIGREEHRDSDDLWADPVEGLTFEFSRVLNWSYVWVRFWFASRLRATQGPEPNGPSKVNQLPSF